MAEGIVVALKGALKGHSITVDPEALDFGLLEDLQSGRASTILDCLARAIVDGDLPRGVDRDGLRRLKATEIRAVVEGVGAALEVPKS